jgi:small subunit ribosomal protein S18
MLPTRLFFPGQRYQLEDLLPNQQRQERNNAPRGTVSLHKRKKLSPLRRVAPNDVNYGNTFVLSRFITESGKIMPRRMNNVTAKEQRALTLAIKRAREVGVLPYQFKLQPPRRNNFNPGSRPSR